ncbi:MAG: hypothetical protein AABX54_02940 [Nanoarchaeota archaeon]
MVMLELINFFHFIGLSFGIGGATIATILSIKASKDKEIQKIQGKIMSPIVKLIWIGIFLLIVTGIALPFYVKWPLNTPLLIIKHIFVAWIIIIGIMIEIISKRRKNPKILSIINLILWYLVTLLSVFI